jgi:hypothetical protein
MSFTGIKNESSYVFYKGVPTSEVGYTQPKPGGETMKSIRDMWWHWGEKYFLQVHVRIDKKVVLQVINPFTYLSS